MESDLKKACRMLKEQELTCAFVFGEEVYISRERGVKPLLDCYYQKKMLPGFSAADKVIGKAAAFLYVLLGVSEIYTDVISRPALSVLQQSGIEVYYEQLTESIKNRAGTGFCPMETAVLSIEDPSEALCAIEKTAEALRKTEVQKET